MRRRPLLPLLCALALVAVLPGRAQAQDFAVDLSQCRDQLEAFARLQLDCPVSVTPSESGLQQMPEMLRQLLSGLTCTTQVTANKADVYGQWITAGRFDPPRKQITCRHPNIQNQRLTATVDVTCTRDGDSWSCPPGVEQIEGAGMLGQYLTQYLNQGSGLWSGLEQELAKRD
ncbi:hypothetical protein CKO28_11365 [Rhodovibrio sodomensis]|uniref:DUF3617 domain-containing protein n=1 Tax=Rhodovibrio sodomensis TaxID=1088 RepID=A0ABS1DGH0_9PROT|nr:hypothetical protein [Rhodovibrio sodomensis]MBK1668628.1 hypothetical protein [Rhodovibrio sodomensis]